MFAYCAISFLSVFSLTEVKIKFDTFHLAAIKLGCVNPEGPVDTVFVKVQRMDFASLGRAKREWNDNNFTSRNLTESLADHGVFFKQYGVMGSSTISRRGADANQTQVLWNGLPINNPMIGMSDFNTLLAWGMSDVSLIEGGNSATVGSGSVGGTLFVRNQGHYNQGFTAKGLSSVGSFGLRDVGLDLGWGGAKRSLAITAASFNHKNAFTFSDLGLDLTKRVMENAMRNQNLIRLVYSQRSEKHELKICSEWMDVSRQLGLALGSFNPLGKQLDFNERNVIEYQYQPNAKWYTVNRVGYIRDQIEYFSNPFEVNGSKSLAKTIHLQSEWYRQWKQNRLLLGFDAQSQKAISDHYLGWAHRSLPSSFVGFNINRNRLTIVLNGRYEWYDHVPTAGFSAQYQYRSNWQLKSNIHSSFRRPTLNDLFWVTGNERQILSAEKGWGAECGVAFLQKQSGMMVSAEATVYIRQLDQPIVWLPNGSYWRAVNLTGGGKYQGVQLSIKAKGKLQQCFWLLEVNGDFVNSAVRMSPASATYQQIFVPNYNANISPGLSWKLWEAKASLQMIGRRYVQTDNLSSMIPYQLLNFQLQHNGLHPKSRKFDASLKVEAQNLLNQAYQSMPGRPMPGRTFKISLLILFKNKLKS